jgi:hypothetical protein
VENPYQPPAASPGDAELVTPLGAGEQRPTSVTVFGILNIIFGSLGILCTPFALMVLFVTPPPGQGQNPNPAIELMKDPGYRTITVVMSGLGIVASAVLLASGIGLLRLRPWGRALAIGYAFYALAAALVNMVVSYVYLIAPMMEAAQKNNNPQSTGAAVGGTIGGLIGSVGSLIYPVLLLVFMTRPRVVRAFASALRVKELPTLGPLEE